VNPVDQLTRCVECDEWIDPLEVAHAAHEERCDVDPDCEDWSCQCDAYAHRRCCRACRPVVIPGQVSLLPDPPVASTRGLPKLRSA
jgi:hypothetical protein